MPKPKKKKPYAPPTSWDTGPNTPAQQAGKVIEAVDDIDPETGKKNNPNGVKRARRVDMLEVYYKRGWISRRGYTAGEALQRAWEGTQRSPGAPDNDRVQVSANPGLAVTMQIDRLSKLVKVSKFVAHGIVWHVAIDNCAIGSYAERGRKIYLGLNHDKGKAEMAEAFEAFADNLGY